MVTPPARTGRQVSGGKPTNSSAANRFARLKPATLALWTVLLCQAVTVIITWPVWNVRSQPVPLPLVDAAWFSFGPLMLVTLAAAAIWPRWGVAAHAAVYALACVADQWRVQPQVISLVVLMFGCLGAGGLWFARAYLASMWLWSGLHKLLSPEWFGWSAWTFLHGAGLPAGWYWEFALAVALFEIALGVLAIFAPRRAAPLCIGMHLGILLLLSPLFRNFNESVWPWNLATAAVGPWILRQPLASMKGRWEWGVLVALLVLPAGYYFNWVNPHLAFVLYSGNMPLALHVSPHVSPRGTKQLAGWQELNVPFPDSPRLLVEAFRRTAAPGDKLHVADPRPWLADRYFQLRSPGRVEEISRAAFLRAADDEVAGVELDDVNARWKLQRLGAKLERDADGPVESLVLEGPRVTDDVWPHVAGLRNLRELRLTGCATGGKGLGAIRELARLEILDVRRSPLDDAGLAELPELPSLLWLRLEETSVTEAGIIQLEKRTRLEALELPGVKLGPGALEAINRLTKLTLLDLSGTNLDDAGLRRLTGLKALELLNLRGTQVTDEGVAQLRRRLPRCEVIR